MAASRDGPLRASLLDVRDELAGSTQLVAALWLACQAPHLPENERRALCALADVARQNLTQCLKAIDALISDQRGG